MVSLSKIDGVAKVLINGVNQPSQKGNKVASKIFTAPPLLAF